LIRRRVRGQVENDADPLEAYGRVLRDTERAAKIQIAFSANFAAPYDDADRSSNRAERYSGARDEGLEQHVARARVESASSRSWMEAGSGERAGSLDVAGDVLAETGLGDERDNRSLRIGLVMLLQGRLDRPKLFRLHQRSTIAFRQSRGARPRKGSAPDGKLHVAPTRCKSAR